MFRTPAQDLPHFSYETASFLTDYLPSFRTNFCQFCADFEVAPQLPVSCELYAEKLYLAMFGQALSSSNELVEESIREFVTETIDAEQVLLKTWMRMINDFVDMLEASSSSTPLLLELVNWVDALSARVYHTYFLTSQESSRDLSQLTPDAQQTMRNLARAYRDKVRAVDDDNGETDNLLAASTYFRGVNIEFQLTIQSVNSGQIICSTEPRHAAVASRSDHLLISGPDDLGPVLAKVTKSDLQTNMVQLKPVEQLPTAGDRRSLLRVEPQAPTDIEIHHAAGNCRGTIIDIAETSAAIYLRNTGIDPANRVEMEFTLDGCGDQNAQTFKITGEVTLVRADKRGDTRAHILVIKFEDDTATRSRLSTYVANRQTQILREIRHIMEGRV